MNETRNEVGSVTRVLPELARHLALHRPALSPEAQGRRLTINPRSTKGAGTDRMIDGQVDVPRLLERVSNG